MGRKQQRQTTIKINFRKKASEKTRKSESLKQEEEEDISKEEWKRREIVSVSNEDTWFGWNLRWKVGNGSKMFKSVYKMLKKCSKIESNVPKMFKSQKENNYLKFEFFAMI